MDVRVTSDGGATWAEGLHTTTGFAVGLDAATGQTAWVMMQDGAYCTSSNCSKYDLYRTVDGGLHWTSLGNPKGDAGTCAFGALVGPVFASDARGWLAVTLGAGGVQGGPGGLLSTDDGGVTWRCTNIPPNTDLVSAADPLHVWAASEVRPAGTTTLYATDDGGRTWHALDLASPR